MTRKKFEQLIVIIFCVVVSYILICTLCFDWVEYYLKKSFLLPNILNLVIAIGVGYLLWFCWNKIYHQGVFLKRLIICFSILFFIQLIIAYCIYFDTGWDAGAIDNLANTFVANGNLSKSEYLSLYPNNMLLTAILAFIKTIPFFGKYHFTIVAINVALVNLAGFFTVIIIKRLIGEKQALFAIIPVAILLLLSPWITIAYSDTFTILFPVAILYFYTNKRKSGLDYFLIFALASIGYHIKPTSLIILIAIILVEISSRRFKEIAAIFKKWKILACIILGIFSGFIINWCATEYLGFSQNENIRPTQFTHFLSMGQNDRTLGVWAVEDTDEAVDDGMSNTERFWHRLSSRNFIEQISFFSRKLLLNYNDGTFAWGCEGNFYANIPDEKGPLSAFLRNIFYSFGKYYVILSEIEQLVWIACLAGCLLIVFKKNKEKNILVIMLTIVGMTMFLLLFEPRARYLFCYVPVFIIGASIGFTSVYRRIRASRAIIKT